MNSLAVARCQKSHICKHLHCVVGGSLCHLFKSFIDSIVTCLFVSRAKPMAGQKGEGARLSRQIEMAKIEPAITKRKLRRVFNMLVKGWVGV